LVNSFLFIAIKGKYKEKACGEHSMRLPKIVVAVSILYLAKNANTNTKMWVEMNVIATTCFQQVSQ
jgi:hypothetical protein